MALEFVQDAISLSGFTGSKLKSEIIGDYYPFWWNITSGGDRAKHEWPTAIIELDAATGEMYIKDTKETILGSSGHALELKCNNKNTKYLKTVLVEKDANCYSHLKKVIVRRWPQVNISEAEGPLQNNQSNIFLMNVELDEALNAIAKLGLRNSLFFFDPLRSVANETIEKVAKARINTYYQTGTEFIVFLFTSDWFLGRDHFVGLPTVIDESSWSKAQRDTVIEADGLFGNTGWRSRILNNKPVYERESDFVELYKTDLRKWFRYALPMPFNPKANQIFHLILCSNYEAGVSATRRFFCNKTGNPNYSPNNKDASDRFRSRHPELFEKLKGNEKPKQFRILWKTVTGHEGGFCDCKCRDFEDIESIEGVRAQQLEWLASKGYMANCGTSNPWNLPVTQYVVNWQSIKDLLNIEPPPILKPLSLKPSSLKEISE